MMRITIDGGAAPFAASVPMLWQIAREVRVAVLDSLAGHHQDLRQATAMVASELAENVVKYGLGAEGEEPYVRVEVLSDRIRVQTCNAASEAAVRLVTDTIAKIEQHEDPMELYAKVIDESLQRTISGVSQQGLYRIVAVAGFTLSAGIRDDGRLEIVAERRIG
jgi:hypothetical protein